MRPFWAALGGRAALRLTAALVAVTVALPALVLALPPARQPLAFERNPRRGAQAERPGAGGDFAELVFPGETGDLGEPAAPPADPAAGGGGAGNKPAPPSFWQQQIVGPARGTLRVEWGSALREPARAVANRAGARLQWERLVGERVFARADAKARWMAGSDHQSVAAGEEGGLVETEIREAYLQFSGTSFSAKVGRQVVAWGETEITVATDVISPRDLSEFLFVSLEDARLGQELVKVEYFGAGGQWSLLWVPAPRVNRLPRPGSEYALPGPENDPAYEVAGQEPAASPGNGEWGLRWWRGFGSGDLSLMAASVLANQPSYRLQAGDGGTIRLSRVYPRYGMAGVAANFTSGRLLLRGELAIKAGRTFAAADPTPAESLLLRDTVDTGLTLEFATATSHQWVLSWGNRHVLGWGADLAGVKENEGTLLAAWSKDFLYETLSVSVNAVGLLPHDDWIYRGTVAYKFSDRWRGELDLAFFQPASQTSPLAAMADKDRLTLRVEYAF